MGQDSELRSKPSIFKDPKHEDQFQKDGFLVVPFLTDNEITEIKTFYDQVHQEDLKQYTSPAYAPGLFASTFINDEKYRREVNDKVEMMFKRAIDTHFREYKNFSSGFIVKLPDPDSYLPIHQDYTLMDERYFTPYSIWCPLQDIDESIGVLRVLRGSHNFPFDWRGMTIPNPYKTHDDLLMEYMEPVYVKAGTAIVFTHKTFHCSDPNLTDRPRVIALSLVAHQNARITIAYRDNQAPHQLEVYTQDDDFFVKHSQFSSDILKRPKTGQLSETIPYTDTELTRDDLLTLIRQVQNRE